MKTWSRGWTLAAGIGLILLTNAVALGGAWWNRAGEPESQLLLTERELVLPYRGYRMAENSGLALRLAWRVADADGKSQYSNYGGGGVPAWLDAERMAALGFETRADPAGQETRRRYERQQPREVLIVLELAGPDWQAALQQAEENAARHAAAAAVNADSQEFANRAKRAQEAWQHEELSSSRLFAIDAGRDLATLRARYPDTTRFMIINGTLRPRLLTRDKQQRFAGYIDDVSASRINVPFALRPVLEQLQTRPRNQVEDEEPRYAATLAIGQRQEPWIMAVSALKPDPAARTTP
ncbi:MAG: DUF4824 family protein [Gammaproteobacteria bacterium]|nr:DUF4824 family protein [Rhodocyclaceae bacterium]MBU3908662.1 DUF4824 family protein [Gammaproteobacteria bacterium]MBU3988973.1 DUF4824 family protein [Gammaproteobacteria bacterium]MBU4004690.1 DUF4824 family protein [Gammaproteobacteria bacterium]MBU4021293.1 DUF4824 family protein [Gammaproteobacteria bacterium]